MIQPKTSDDDADADNDVALSLEIAHVAKDIAPLAVSDEDKLRAEDAKTRANALFALKKYSEAAELYSTAIAFDPKNPVYYSNRAFAYIRSEFYGAAITDAETAIALDPKFIKAYYRRAVGHMALGKLKDAVKDFKAVVKVAPRDADARAKLQECEKELKRRMFENAISFNEVKKSALEAIGDIDSIIVESSYDGPHLPSTGITHEFCVSLLDYMKAQKKLHRKYVYIILVAAKKIFDASPTVVDIAVPKGRRITVCGDIHGQYYDLLNIFEMNGLPSDENMYLFNGDFVDRGSFSVECILALLAFKVLSPNCLYMSRGNHETDDMNKVYGFEGEVKAKYSDVMFKLFSEIFNAVPLGNIIGEKIFVIHGGLFSRDGVTMDEIRKIDRFKQPGSEGLMCELLWSDPQNTPGRSRSKRGVGTQFGPDVTEAFCKANNLDMIIRSHEVKDNGYEIAHNGRCVTTEFVPASGKLVNWYTCGPTVYDKSHMGHARNYITFDIIRRIMEDYFNYDVNFVMNITDIDDKIIVAARSNYLFENKKASTPCLSIELIKEVEDAFESFVVSNLGKYLSPPASANGLDDLVKNGKFPSLNDEPKFQMWLKAATRAKAAISAAKSVLKKKGSSKSDSDALFEECKDVYAPALDAQLKHTVTDHKIFRDFAAYWEREYFKDMDALNIRRPDVLTRVSEYVPEIVAFVEKIIANGYAYESEGSVYFDTHRFDKSPNHHYAKLEPWSASNMKLIQEGEGDLSAANKLGKKKRNDADFALWKSSKPGEPAWDSPWGAGRPGWHIECSAMAGDVLGEQMDIHSGGIDLAFPHHDNELAQSEAHYNCAQWVNYFLHAGHLHTEGQKMSKSLKNFDSISDALKTNTASQIRIMFLLHGWDSILDYKQSSLQEARVFETAINNFLINVKAVIQELRSKEDEFTGNHNYHQPEKDLIALFQQKQSQIHAALCDNFDTATAMLAIRDIISATNTYLKQTKTQAPNVLLKVSSYVAKMMRTFGVHKDESGVGSGDGASASTNSSVEDVAGPYVRLLASFRDRVREIARRSGENGTGGELLRLCDQVRDVELVDLNVALDDRDDGKALVKFIDRETILKQRQEKQEAQARAAAEKERKRAEMALIEAERLAKGATPPSEMFKDEEGRKQYSAWDERGIPTKKIDGEEISKGVAKKLLKNYEAQAKLHERYLASLKK
ncbi:hypothetical protein HDU83_005544 [Entophlyctis luteolus]|nr:hypothetical protein HDU83_005544 [Entophlyctis luteolus]